MFKTVNEARAEKGLEPIKGGDVILDGVLIQSIGQLMQQEQFKYQKQQDKLNRLLELSGGEADDSNVISFQDKQQGLDGTSASVNGKGESSVGKDGQIKGKGITNTNSAKQGMKGDKPNDWQK